MRLEAPRNSFSVRSPVCCLLLLISRGQPLLPHVPEQRGFLQGFRQAQPDRGTEDQARSRAGTVQEDGCTKGAHGEIHAGHEERPDSGAICADAVVAESLRDWVAVRLVSANCRFRPIPLPWSRQRREQSLCRLRWPSSIKLPPPCRQSVRAP